MGCSFYRRERNHLSATDAWREAAVGDCRYMCIRTASFEGGVSKQMVVKTDQPGDRHPQTKTRSALGTVLYSATIATGSRHVRLARPVSEGCG